jgi:membrane associated rhomboid family serine protease
MRYGLIMNSGDGYDHEENSIGNDNVVPLKVPRKKRDKKKDPPPFDYEPQNEPIINLPPVTKYFLGVIIAIHLIVTFLLTQDQLEWVLLRLGFIPAFFSGHATFTPLAALTPLTHMFLHGSWLHLAMNSIMLLAFGSGIEKWMGGKNMLILFFISGLFGIVTHFALNHDSIYPVVGASGGLSGLFAAALIMINQQQGGVHKIWPFIVLWIGISVLFGFMGSPDGGQIAWAAHVGGFLGGFAAMKLLKRF